MHNTPTNTKKRRIWLKLFLSIIGFFALLILWWFVFCISRFSCADDIPTRIELWWDVLLTKLYPKNILVKYMATRWWFWDYYFHCFSDTNGGKYITNLWIKNAEDLIQIAEHKQWSYFSEKNKIGIYLYLLLNSDFENKNDLLKNQDYIKNISIDQLYFLAWIKHMFTYDNEIKNEEVLKIAENYILKALSIHQYPVYYDALKNIHIETKNTDAAIEDIKNFINIVSSWYINYDLPKELLDKYNDTSDMQFKDEYLYIPWFNDFLALEELADLYQEKWDYKNAIETLRSAQIWANSTIWKECRYTEDERLFRLCSPDEESLSESGESKFIFTESDSQEYIQKIEERINTLKTPPQEESNDLFTTK